MVELSSFTSALTWGSVRHIGHERDPLGGRFEKDRFFATQAVPGATQTEGIPRESNPFDARLSGRLLQANDLRWMVGVQTESLIGGRQWSALNAAPFGARAASTEPLLSKRSVWEVLDLYAGSVDAPADWATQHDHYIYGSPRKL